MRVHVDFGRAARALAASAVLLVVVTAAIELLKPHVPVLSLGALYLFVVLPIAVFWGPAYAVAVSVACMLAFNWFFLEPLHTFTLQDSRNWFALGVYVVIAVVVSELAARSRRQAQEAALLAEIAGSLLRHGDVAGELDRVAAETAAALHAERASIDLDGNAGAADGERFPLVVEGRSVGSITLWGPHHGSAAARRRVLPALASLLGVAIDRERLEREALDAEALRRSDAMKTAVLRAVSHDLRSPLMAILTSASALARDDLELGRDDRAELARTIFDEAGRLDRLVANLLDLSRLQAGAAQPDSQVWALEDLVLQALDDAGDDGGRVKVSLPDESPAVRADAHQVERVLANLIENALKYSPPDEPVHVQVMTSGDQALVRVVDHGVGVTPRERERIFEPFQRGRNGATRGAGLGLAIARGFAEANGGQVWAESRAGQGAAFVLELPMLNGAAP
jgi:two-component system, OmpR family, sensor histidine kinase KdpD